MALLLADDMHGTRPRCWNRPPASAGNWYPVGTRNGKRVLRWFPRWFEDRCATWDGTGIGPTPETTRYPQAHRWDCDGCRLLPTGMSA